MSDDNFFEENSHFNPLPPHGGRPFAAVVSFVMLSVFQSTPSAWRETQIRLDLVSRTVISIHSLRMEGDQSDWV